MLTRTANTMTAWRSHGRGADDVRLETAEIPVPGPGAALIQVVHAGLNFSDVLMLEDRYQVRPPRPFIPGQEVAGIVVDAGLDSRLTPGDRVASKVEWGAFAPWAVVRDNMAIVLEEATDLASAVGPPSGLHDGLGGPRGAGSVDSWRGATRPWCRRGCRIGRGRDREGTRCTRYRNCEHIGQAGIGAYLRSGRGGGLHGHRVDRGGRRSVGRARGRRRL